MPVTSQERAQASRKIPVINGLRGIAILGVIVAHALPSVKPWLSAISLGPFVLFPMTIFSNGYQGVTLFFLLSGFVLALPYAQGRRTMQSAADVVMFYKRRAIRLVPLYAVCMIVSILLNPPESLLRDIGLYATFMFIFFEHSFFPSPNGVLWTLGVEWWLSLLLPLFLRLRRIVRIEALAITAAILSLVIQYVSIATYWTPVIADGLPVRLDVFLYGMVLAERYVEGKPAIRGGMFFGCLFLLLSFYASDLAYSVKQLTGNAHADAYVWLRPLISPLSGIGFFFLTDSLLRLKRGFLSNVLTNAPLQMIGLMCYSVYIWHFILIPVLHARQDAGHFFTYLFVLSVISLFSYFYIEFGHVRDVRRLLPVRE